MTNFIIQAFRNLENVNADNMTTFYKNTPQELTSFFPITPCICNGVGNIINNFGQVGTSNVFAFINGVVRFPDQSIPVLTTTASCFATYNAASVTVTSPSSPGSQYYIVANVTFTALDTYNSQTSGAILSTAMTLAQIAAETNPLAYMPICAITNTSGVYTVFIDSNCAYNYGLSTSQILPDYVDNVATGSTTTGGRVIDGIQQLITHGSGGSTSMVQTSNGNSALILTDSTGKTSQCGLYSGSATGFNLLVTETDGSTPNTGLDANYGDRLALVGNLSTLAKGNNSIASLSEISRTKTSGNLFMAASYDINLGRWSAIITGGVFLTPTAGTQTYTNQTDLSTAFGMTSPTGSGTLTYRAGGGITASIDYSYCDLASSPNLTSYLNFSTDTGFPTLVGYVSILIFATNIS